MTASVLALEEVTKSFAATQALSGVSFDVLAGEIHAVVGENGAGKSTLINIISGNLTPDSGAVVINGTVQQLSSPYQALKRGISTVHQELSVVEHLSVAENIYASRPPARAGIVRWGALAQQAKAFVTSLSMPLDVSARVGTLPVSSRQLVEIAKAVASNPRIILFDEPTSALSNDEKEALFQLIFRLRASGIAIIHVSHHLQEIMQLADRVSVLRDGKHVGTWDKAEVDPSFLVTKMVGREMSRGANVKSEPSTVVVLHAEHLSFHGNTRDVSLQLHAREIVALAGQAGSGRGAVAAILAGVRRPTSGRINWQGNYVSLRSLRHAMDLGIGYVPPERKTDGLFLDLSLADNIMAASLGRASCHGLFSHKRAGNIATEFMRKLGIKAKSPAQRAGGLSGGNQQKVLLAKWLARKPQLLIIEEPTKGVDIAAKHEIHTMLRELAALGTAILIVSSDLPEIIALSHRVLVMRGGKLIAERKTTETTEEDIAALTSGLETARS